MFYRKLEQKLFVFRHILKKRIFDVLRKKKRISKKIHINFGSGLISRYLYVYSFFFANWAKVILQINYTLLKSIKDYADLIFTEPNIIFTDKKQACQTIELYHQSKKKIFNIDYNFFGIKQLKSNEFAMPYSLHPSFYSYHKDISIHALRNNERKINILFLGASNIESYNNPVLTEKFSLLTRYEIIENLKEEPDLAKYPSNDLKVNELIQNGCLKPVICNTMNFQIKQENLFKLYSQINFYLALPGVCMPLCHNIIESMAVGAIPILQYQNYFHPNLVHGVNCISFTSYADLLEKIDYCMKMPLNEISILRNNVIKYYDKYLAPEAFKVNLCKFIEQNDTGIVYMNIEQESVRLFEQNQ